MADCIVVSILAPSNSPQRVQAWVRVWRRPKSPRQVRRGNVTVTTDSAAPIALVGPCIQSADDVPGCGDFVHAH